MQNVALIGIDPDKHSFHIHCQDKQSNPLLRKKFSRPQLINFLATCTPSTVAFESCAGAHFMARTIGKLGHQAMAALHAGEQAGPDSMGSYGYSGRVTVNKRANEKLVSSVN